MIEDTFISRCVVVANEVTLKNPDTAFFGWIRENRFRLRKKRKNVFYKPMCKSDISASGRTKILDENESKINFVQVERAVDTKCIPKEISRTRDHFRLESETRRIY